jgi:hypothetical protein
LCEAKVGSGRCPRTSEDEDFTALFQKSVAVSLGKHKGHTRSMHSQVAGTDSPNSLLLPISILPTLSSENKDNFQICLGPKSSSNPTLCQFLRGALVPYWGGDRPRTESSHNPQSWGHAHLPCSKPLQPACPTFLPKAFVPLAHVLPGLFCPRVGYIGDKSTISGHADRLSYLQEGKQGGILQFHENCVLTFCRRAIGAPIPLFPTLSGG